MDTDLVPLVSTSLLDSFVLRCVWLYGVSSYWPKLILISSLQLCPKSTSDNWQRLSIEGLGDLFKGLGFEVSDKYHSTALPYSFHYPLIQLCNSIQSHHPFAHTNHPIPLILLILFLLILPFTHHPILLLP